MNNYLIFMFAILAVFQLKLVIGLMLMVLSFKGLLKIWKCSYEN